MGLVSDRLMIMWGWSVPLTPNWQEISTTVEILSHFQMKPFRVFGQQQCCDMLMVTVIYCTEPPPVNTSAVMWHFDRWNEELLSKVKSHLKTSGGKNKSQITEIFQVWHVWLFFLTWMWNILDSVSSGSFDQLCVGEAPFGKPAAFYCVFMVKNRDELHSLQWSFLI